MGDIKKKNHNFFSIMFRLKLVWKIKNPTPRAGSDAGLRMIQEVTFFGLLVGFHSVWLESTWLSEGGGRSIMGTALCGGPSLWVFSSQRRQDVHRQGQCRSNGVATLCCHHSSTELNSLLQIRATGFRAIYGCASGSQGALSKQGLAGASWPARSRQGRKKKGSTSVVYCVEHLGLDAKASEEDASAAQGDTRSSLDSSATIGEKSSEGGALELVDTDGIIFEESDEDDGNDINGMLRQPRSFFVEDLNDWEMFAAEEGANPAADDETESDTEMEDGPRLVRRRKAEDVLPFPDSAAMNWTAADKEKVKALQAFKHR
jgi:hypothetical protein